MKVKLLTSIASTDWSYAFGQIVEIDTKLATAWIKSGIAELVGGKQIETATAEPSEKAVLPAAKKKKVK